MKGSYHHGNLRHDLLETSIQIISEKGFEALSLRGISSLCGVSHNAVYRHFENKEQLIFACQEYVTERMMAYLNEAIAGVDHSSGEALQRLSAAYVSFYQQYPTYYSALYRNSPVKLNFSAEATGKNYPPLELFQCVCAAYGERKGWTPEQMQIRLTQLWALVHGLTALVISPNVIRTWDWQKCLENIVE